MKLVDSKLFLPTYKLVKQLIEITAKFNRNVRDTLSNNLVNEGLNMLKQVNHELLTKKFVSNEFKEHIANTLTYLRLSYDTRNLSLNNYSNLVQKIYELNGLLQDFTKVDQDLPKS